MFSCWFHDRSGLDVFRKMISIERSCFTCSVALAVATWVDKFWPFEAIEVNVSHAERAVLCWVLCNLTFYMLRYVMPACFFVKAFTFQWCHCKTEAIHYTLWSWQYKYQSSIALKNSHFPSSKPFSKIIFVVSCCGKRPPGRTRHHGVEIASWDAARDPWCCCWYLELEHRSTYMGVSKNRGGPPNHPF